MAHRMTGRRSAALTRTARRAAAQAGQGTVEYVALILLVAAVMAAVVGATTNAKEGGAIAGKVTGEIKSAIESVKSDK